MGMTSDWTATDSKDNADATATKAANANARHCITAVTASFSAAATKLLQIKDGTTVILERYVYSAADLTFNAPIRASYNSAVSAVLTASGTGGVIGKVGLTGYTE